MERLEEIQKLEWSESMATGITIIDRHHQYLVDTLQEANQHLQKGHDPIYLKKFVKDLLGYAIMHFETEESLMQLHDYASAHPEDAQRHIAQHRDFSSKLVALNEQLRTGGSVSSAEVLLFFNNWLRDHVLGIDQLLGAFLYRKMKQTDTEG